jgi:hypothetical protein
VTRDNGNNNNNNNNNTRSEHLKNPNMENSLQEHHVDKDPSLLWLAAGYYIS